MWLPGIEQGDTGRLEVCDVVGGDCETVDHRGRGDQGNSFRAPVENRKLRATLRDGGVDREDAVLAPLVS
jgi:hypothetical protein